MKYSRRRLTNSIELRIGSHSANLLLHLSTMWVDQRHAL